jgi:hypothetical protein
MCDLLTLAAMLSATSSPASAGGVARSRLPGGQATDKSGPEAAPASRSATRGKGKASPTKGISGPSGLGSSASAALQSSLENRLRERLGTDGSTPWPMIWREKATPSGRRYCQLALCRRRTKDSGSGLWPTPEAGAFGGASNIEKTLERREKYKKKYGNNGFGLTLSQEVARRNLLWPTPTSTLGSNGGLVTPEKAREGGTLIEAVSARQMWPTPHTNMSTGPGRQGREGGMNLQTATGGPLNPTFPAWLMGYPPEWLSCAPSATRLSRKSRRNS